MQPVRRRPLVDSSRARSFLAGAIPRRLDPAQKVTMIVNTVRAGMTRNAPMRVAVAVVATTTTPPIVQIQTAIWMRDMAVRVLRRRALKKPEIGIGNARERKATMMSLPMTFLKVSKK
jgi:hypothetical protein